MTKLPHTIGKEQTLTMAHTLMRSHHIRHLPVLDGGRVVGVVSDRDLNLLETLRDVDPDDVAVEDAMTPDPFTCSPTESLSSVARVMAEKKYGAAVVTEGHKVVGVFTAVDGLRVLSEILDRP